MDYIFMHVTRNLEMHCIRQKGKGYIYESKDN